MMDPLEAHRARLVARALELVQPDVHKCLENGIATIVRGPAAEAVGLLPAASGVAVAMLAHFRSSSWAQSGSDWGEHEIRIYELTVADDGAIVAERLVAQRSLHIREGAEDGYDDASVAKSVADEIVGKVPLANIAPRARVEARAAPSAWVAEVRAAGVRSEALELQRAFADDDETREALVSASTPLAVFLRRAGAFVDPVYEEVQYTDWNGANVGSGSGELIRAGIPLDPALPWDELARLLELSTFARVLVARHPATPTEALLLLAEDSDWSVQRAVLHRPANDPTVVDRLRHSHHDVIRALLAPPVSREAQPARTPMARAHLGPPEGPPDSEARARSARSPSLTREDALAFARDESFLVRCALAENAQADAMILEPLMDDPHASVRVALAENPRFTQLALLATDPNSAVRRAVAARSDTPREVLEMLSRDSQTVVRDRATETLRLLRA